MPEPLVFLNGAPQPWVPGLSLAELLSAETGKVATALNGEFVPQSARPLALLQPGDQVTVFTAIVGG